MYLLTVVSVIVLIGVLCLYGGSFRAIVFFLDIPTAVLLLLFTMALLLSAGMLKDFNNAFRLVIGKKKVQGLKELKRAEEAVSLAFRMLISEGVFFFFVESVIILGRMDTPMALGPNLAVAILSLVYSLGAALMLLPLKSILSMKIQEFISEEE
ncbi:MAG: hypothetical protein IJC59_08100 [Lachnospiraceae bacterium]|nr:hypothetical protein [Lachnospiraceae bacterium]